ncbi:ABC transporter permease [Streptomyces sp. QH1-20]|uniref:ABC transporter permease n=1 Tax=Streptomyces sp. QH1-20 TaxID=3240934 RepID=UPI003513C5C8
MAEVSVRGDDGPVREAEGPLSGLLHGLRAYGLIVAMWVRSTMAYRTSFVMMAVGNFLTSGLDFVAILLMFSHIDALGGFSLPEIALLYGATSTSFGLVDLFLGNAERVGRRVRDGTLDTLLLRPVPVLAQIAADRFALRRLGRIAQGVVVLVWGLAGADIAWTPVDVVLVPVMLISGAGIFAALFVAGAAFQFWASDASQAQNSFTYGGTTLLQYPPTVFSQDLVRGVTFVVPLAFVNWLPALRILDREDPLGLPGWVDFCGPAVALVMIALSGLAWRAGLRSYRSTGS